MATILVVDDDLNTLKVVERGLSWEGHEVVGVSEPHRALTTARDAQPDLIILDVVLTSSNGLNLCTQLRRLPYLTDVPILFLTTYHSAYEVALALDSGGDDLMRKPFSVVELNARINALLRRASRWKTQAAHLILINPELRTVVVDGRAVSLTPVEFDLLDYLCLHDHKYHTANDLLAAVWNYPPGSGDTALVRNHIHNLRHKLEFDPDRPRIITSLHGRGYRINADILREQPSNKVSV